MQYIFDTCFILQRNSGELLTRSQRKKMQQLH